MKVSSAPSRRLTTLFLAGALSLAFLESAESAETLVSDPKELQAALSSAKPGSIIVMKDGVWQDVNITLTRPGSAEEPVVLKAQNDGAVVISGSSQLIFNADWQTVIGLCFKEGGNITDKRYFSVIRFNSNNCRLTQSAIIDFKPQDPASRYFYVFFSGTSNRMDHCLLSGKINNQPVVGNGSDNSRFNQVDHCVIRDIPFLPDNNGREIFRIWGYGGDDQQGADDGAFFTIEKNLLDHADGEGAEIISLKSCHNIVRNNIVRASRGELSIRSGNFNLVEGNVIIGEKGRGSKGIRVAGRGHRILNNTVRDCENGITLLCGEYIERDLTGSYTPVKRANTPLGRVPSYAWVSDVRVEGNRLINNDGADIDLGARYTNRWPARQMILLPENCAIVSNLVVKKAGLEVVSVTEQKMSEPFDIVKFRPNLWMDNVCVGGRLTSQPEVARGFKLNDLTAKSANPFPSPRDYDPTGEDILKEEEIGPAWSTRPPKQSPDH